MLVPWCRRRLCSTLAAALAVSCTLLTLLTLQSRHRREAALWLPTRSPAVLVGSSSVRPEPVARIVHQSWRSADQLPTRFAAWRASWPVCFPAWQHRLWTDEANLLLVRQKSPVFIDHYLRYTENIQRADSARYLYLYHYGGLYTDLDNECLQPFEHLLLGNGGNDSLANCGVLLSSMRRSRPGRRPYVENSLMFARHSGHPFWLTVLDAMAERARMVGATAQETVDLTTGPQLLMHALARYAGANGNNNDNQHGPVCLFPSDRFNPFSWDAGSSAAGPCRDLNRMTDAQVAACRARHRGSAFVLQFHVQSWGAGGV